MINKIRDIKLIGFDVDGVFTDGKIYISEEGKESKVFHTQDGQGIRQLLDHGIKILVISGRDSSATKKRMQELGITDFFLGCREKKPIFQKKVSEYNFTLSDCAFVGDDMSDKDILEIVGFPIAVSNARESIKKICAYTTKNSGGNGAIREITDLIINQK